MNIELLKELLYDIERNKNDHIKVNELILEYSKLYQTKIKETDLINWSDVSQNQKLSEDFIRKFQDKVNWFGISYYQKLSEDFIRGFQDKVNWFGISCNQKLSEDFIREFQEIK